MNDRCGDEVEEEHEQLRHDDHFLDTDSVKK